MVLMYLATPKIMSLVRKRSVSLPLTRTTVSQRIEVDVGVDPGAHGLEGVGVLGAPQRAVGLLPDALAHVVADGVAEHAGQRVGLAQVLRLLADDDDQLALVLHLGGVARDDDRLAVRNQRVDGAIADVGLLGQVGLDALLGGDFADVLGVVEADAIEGGRHHRHLDLHRLQVAHGLGALVAGERVARHLGDAVAFQDAVADAALMRIPDPTHGSSSRSGGHRTLWPLGNGLAWRTDFKNWRLGGT